MRKIISILAVLLFTVTLNVNAAKPKIIATFNDTLRNGWTAVSGLTRDTSVQVIDCRNVDWGIDSCLTLHLIADTSGGNSEGKIGKLYAEVAGRLSLRVTGNTLSTITLNDLAGYGGNITSYVTYLDTIMASSGVTAATANVVSKRIHVAPTNFIQIRIRSYGVGADTNGIVKIYGVVEGTGN